MNLLTASGAASSSSIVGHLGFLDVRSRGNNSRRSAREAIVGQSPSLRIAIDRAERVAATSVPILVTGESGTGKELFARLIHDTSTKAKGPFVAVNCGALPRELAESELFGHERGAFTGATARRTGWFEEANGGTLVLDEVGELPLELQPKLLRTLETGTVRRVGGSTDIPVQVRVVALTLRNLPDEIRRGAFRVDLYHRLAGFELRLPSLRQRRDDIPALVASIMREVVRESGPRQLTVAALNRLLQHDWPGNVRELRNVLRRSAVLTDHEIDTGDLDLGSLGRIDTPGLAAESESALGRSRPGSVGTASNDLWFTKPNTEPDSYSSDFLHLAGRHYDDLEREIFRWALARNGGSRRKAARALNISRSTFCDRVKRLGVVQSPRLTPNDPGDTI